MENVIKAASRYLECSMEHLMTHNSVLYDHNTIIVTGENYNSTETKIKNNEEVDATCVMLGIRCKQQTILPIIIFRASHTYAQSVCIIKQM